MLINGQQVSNDQDIEQGLNNLPSSFVNYLSSKQPYIPPQNITDLCGKGWQSLQQNNLNGALKDFQEAERLMSKDQPSNPTLAKIYSDISYIYQLQGNLKDAAINLQKCAEESLKTKDHQWNIAAENSYKNLAVLHHKIGDVAEYEKQNIANLEQGLKKMIQK